MSKITLHEACVTACDKSHFGERTFYHSFARLVNDKCSEFGFKFVDFWTSNPTTDGEIICVTFLNGKWRVVDC